MKKLEGFSKGARVRICVAVEFLAGDETTFVGGEIWVDGEFLNQVVWPR
jgi:hypothetical protein